MPTRAPRWRLHLSALVVTAIAFFAVSGQAFAGPVILGGDDLTSHGSHDGTSNVQGWKYMEVALGNIGSQVTRSNDNSIAALGSASGGGGAGEAIGSAATPNGMPVTYYEGAAAIQGFFNALVSGAAKPRIIWIAGDDASNDLSDPDPCEDSDASNTTEGEALKANASLIDAFVSQGGGLMSHGVCYPWLSALLPGVTAVDASGSDDLYRTSDGIASFPSVSNADFNAGPWHNHFQGNFGGLKVLVRSSAVNDSTGTDAAVFLGGANVNFQPKPPPVVTQSCVRREVSLVRADVRGRNVVLNGLVAPRFAGDQVTIHANYKPGKAKTSRKVATVRSNSAGEFTATVRRPKRKFTKRARFRAQVATFRSVALKIPQALRSTSVKVVSGQIEVRGRVKRTLLGRRNPVTVKLLRCGRYRTVGQARPDRKGRYVVRFTVLPGQEAAIFRAEALVRERRRSSRYIRQYARGLRLTLTNETG